MASDFTIPAPETFKVPLHRSFFFRAVSVFFGTIVVITAIQLVVLTRGLRHTVAEIDQQQYWNFAAELSNRIQPLVYEKLDVAVLSQKLHELFPILPYEIYFLNSRGEAIAAFPSSLIEGEVVRVSLEPIDKALGSTVPELPLFGDNPRLRRKDALFSVAPIKIEREPGYVYVVFNAAIRATLVKTTGQFFIMESSIAAALFLTVCSWILSLAALLYFGRRFKRLNHIIQQYQHGNFSLRAETSQGDEIAVLAETLNLMAGKIESTQALLIERDNRRRELVADIVHDMRGPLTVQRSTIDRALSEQQERTSEELQRDLQILQDSTLLQNEMVRDLFSLSKLEAQERLPELDDISLQSLAERAVNRYQPVCTERELILRYTAPDNLPTVVADETLVTRALSNLIENAIHHSPKRGIIEVALRLVNDENYEERVALSVGDDGHGVSPEDQPKIFERGFGEKEISRGAGLGLAIVRRIAELHKAKLQVENQPSRGACFSILFPIEDE